MPNFEAHNFVRSVALKTEKIENYDHYPFCLPVVAKLGCLKLHPAVTFLVGENGSGKSTLLEAIAAALGFNPEGGTNNFNFSTRASHSSLHQYLRIVKGINRPKTGFFLRAESFFNVASEIDNLGVVDSYGGISLHEQSHGESFFALMQNRFGANGLYTSRAQLFGIAFASFVACSRRKTENYTARSIYSGRTGSRAVSEPANGSHQFNALFNRARLSVYDCYTFADFTFVPERNDLRNTRRGIDGRRL